VGSACEFYLFKTDEDGKALTVPFDDGTFFDLAPADRGENVRRGICLTLYEMNIIPESSHHSVGPGQNEVVFRSSDALSAADNFVTFKSVVKQNAAVSGLYASCMPKPLPTGKSSMLTLDLEVYKGGKNIFDDKALEGEARGFVAGILERLPELTAFLKPSTNSYSEDSRRVLGWSDLSGTYSVCIPAIKGIRGRMELTALDPSINPHLVYALLIRAGLDGIKRGLTLPTMDKSAGKLPATLKQAVSAASKSRFVKTHVGAEVLANCMSREMEAIDGYTKARRKSDFEHDYYFKLL
jgi:glutamine synthetase